MSRATFSSVFMVAGVSVPASSAQASVKPSPVDVAIAERIGLLAVEIDRELDLEGRGGMAQIDQREVAKSQIVRDLEPERALVEVERLGLVEHADHRMHGFRHSVQLLQIGDDHGA